MSVSISRFVNVMSAGKFGKNWFAKPLRKQDNKVAALLESLEASLKSLDGMGLKGGGRVKQLREDYEEMSREFFNGGGGISPAKWLEAEERLRIRVAQALKDAEKLVTDNEQAVMENAIGKPEFDKRLKATTAQIQKLGARVEGLSPTEMVAVRTYTLAQEGEDMKSSVDNPEFKDMNKLYRNEARKRRNQNEPLEPLTGDEAKIKAKNTLLEKGMAKLPNYVAEAPCSRLDIYIYKQGDAPKWPAWPGIYDGYQVGGEMSVDAFWSTGKTGTINSLAEQHIIWTVHGATGKDIDAMSQMKGEGGGEVLFAPRTKFKVESKAFEDLPDSGIKIWRVTVREIVA